MLEYNMPYSMNYICSVTRIREDKSMSELLNSSLPKHVENYSILVIDICGGVVITNSL